MGEPSTQLRALETCWRRETEAAATYRVLAGRERDPRRREILTKLVEARSATRRAGRNESARLGAACPTPPR